MASLYYGVLLPVDTFFRWITFDFNEEEIAGHLGLEFEQFRRSEKYLNYSKDSFKFLFDLYFKNKFGAELTFFNLNLFRSVSEDLEKDFIFCPVEQHDYVFIGQRYRSGIGRFCRLDSLYPRNRKELDQEFIEQGLDQFEVDVYSFQSGYGALNPNSGSICENLKAEVNKIE